MNRLFLILMAALLIAGCDMDRASRQVTPDDGTESSGWQEGQGDEGEAAEEEGPLSQEEIEKAKIVISVIEGIKGPVNPVATVEPTDPTQTDPVTGPELAPTNPTEIDPVTGPEYAPTNPTQINPQDDSTVMRDPTEPLTLEAKKNIVVLVNPPSDGEEEPKVEVAKNIVVEVKPTPPPPPPSSAYFAMPGS